MELNLNKLFSKIDLEKQMEQKKRQTIILPKPNYSINSLQPYFHTKINFHKLKLKSKTKERFYSRHNYKQI